VQDSLPASVICAPLLRVGTTDDHGGVAYLAFGGGEAETCVALPFRGLRCCTADRLHPGRFVLAYRHCHVELKDVSADARVQNYKRLAVDALLSPPSARRVRRCGALAAEIRRELQVSDDRRLIEQLGAMFRALVDVTANDEHRDGVDDDEIAF